MKLLTDRQTDIQMPDKNFLGGGKNLPGSVSGKEFLLEIYAVHLLVRLRWSTAHSATSIFSELSSGR